MACSRNKKRTIAAAVVCGSLLLLPGCHIPALRGPQPAQQMPGVYDVNGEVSCENSAHLGVGQFFNDPILVNLIYEGINGNQELKILYEEIQIANNEYRKRRGTLFPFVTLGGGIGIDKPGEFTRAGAVESQLEITPGRGFPEPLPNFMTAASVSWQVDIWRQLRNSRDAAALRWLGTIDGRNYIVTRLVAEIAESYYELMSLDARRENLIRTIQLQEQSLEIARSRKEAARGTELAVQRFQAEVRKNQGEIQIIEQDLVEVSNRINFLVGRYPQPVQRSLDEFVELNLHALNIGVPSQLLRNRPDIRESERKLQAAGLDVRVARANFYPTFFIRAGVGWEAFNPKYLFMTPESLLYNLAGDLSAPLINKSAIRADYLTANSRQLQAIYDYQRTILSAFTEVINQVSRVQRYTNAIEFRRQQLTSLEASVVAATSLFQNARAEYVDVLFSQRDLRDARMELIEAKRQQLTAIVDAYQALGGGWQMSPQGGPAVVVPPQPQIDLIEPVEPGRPNELPNPPDAPALEDAPAPPVESSETTRMPAVRVAGKLDEPFDPDAPPELDDLLLETPDGDFEEIGKE